MYDYDDYEEDVLLVLRVLKYLHGVQTREEFLKTLNHCTEAGMDELYELADTFTWELFPAAVFDIDEEWGATTMSFSHPNIDCYLSLTGRLDTTHGHRLALRKRLEDIALYFCMVTDSVTGVQFSPMDESTYVKLRFSPDCCAISTGKTGAWRSCAWNSKMKVIRRRPDGSARKQRLYAGLLHPVVPGTGFAHCGGEKGRWGDILSAD